MRADLPGVVRERYPEFEEIYARLGWRMFPGVDRVYVNDRARAALDWQPEYDFRRALHAVAAGEDVRSPLARAIGAKGYHAQSTGPYTVR